MVDLEQERKQFEEQWKILGGHLLYVEWSTDNMYSLSSSANVLIKKDQISLFNTINTAWGLWIVQAKQNKTEIDSLKAENEELKTAYSGVNAALLEQLKLNSDLHEKLLGASDGEFVVVPREPTDNMIDAANEFVSEDYSDMEAAYKAMIEAAQGDGDE